MILKSLALVIAGAAAGIAFVVSCGDDGPSRVDASVVDTHDAPAAACDCPAAEKPLAGRFEQVIKPAVVEPNDYEVAFAACPNGATVISGGCIVSGTTVYNVTLRESAPLGPPGMPPTGWHCRVFNNEASAQVPIEAKAICLKPAA